MSTWTQIDGQGPMPGEEEGEELQANRIRAAGDQIMDEWIERHEGPLIQAERRAQMQQRVDQVAGRMQQQRRAVQEEQRRMTHAEILAEGEELQANW
jgi:hypothetical protein